jgi:hypothetical protein
LAENLSTDGVDLAAIDPTPAPPAGRVRLGRHRRRFAALTVGLVVLLAGAGVLTWVFATADRHKPFSAFKATAEDPVARAQQVADFVAGRYLTAPGQAPLATVDAGEDVQPLLPGQPQSIVVSSSPPALFTFNYGDILFFRICGSGADCALGPDQSNNVLGPIFARQAHELALYGLKNVPEALYAIILLPDGFLDATDGKGPPPKAAHFYRREDLKDEFDRPASETFPGAVPTPATLSPAEFNAIEAKEGKTRYSFTSGTNAPNTMNIYTLVPLF